MRISVGIDIAKEIHSVTAIDANDIVRIVRKLLNTPPDIAALANELTALHGTVRIGLDVTGGTAGLAEAMLAQAGFVLDHVPGVAVDRARQGTVGGENKPDPRDARIIATRSEPGWTCAPSNRRLRSISKSGCWSAAAAIWCRLNRTLVAHAFC